MISSILPDTLLCNTSCMCCRNMLLPRSEPYINISSMSAHEHWAGSIWLGCHSLYQACDCVFCNCFVLSIINVAVQPLLSSPELPFCSSVPMISAPLMPMLYFQFWLSAKLVTASSLVTNLFWLCMVNVHFLSHASCMTCIWKFWSSVDCASSSNLCKMLMIGAKPYCNWCTRLRLIIRSFIH